MAIGFTKDVYVDGTTGASATRMNNLSDHLEQVCQSIAKGPMFVVAASNSATYQKQAADYVCDGVNDETEINAAITAANAAGGGVVHLCAGNYILGASVQIRSGTVLQGEGTLGTNIKVMNNAPSPVNMVVNATGGTVTKITIRDIVFDCNKANNTQVTQGIYLTNVSNTPVIVNCIVKNSKGGYNIWLDTTADGVLILGCSVTAADLDGIYLQGSHHRIIGCYIATNGVGYAGVNIMGASYCMVGHNTFYANDRGIWVQGNSNDIVGNILDSHTSHGIYVQPTANYANITGNIVHTGALTGIICNGVNCTVSGNSCAGNANHGISMNSGTRNTVVGNTCMMNGQHGIFLYTCTDCTVVGNNCQYNSTGANLGYNNISIAQTSTYNNVQGNICRVGTNVNKPAYGIQIEAGSNYNMVTNNDLHTGGQTGAFLDSATGTVTAAGNRTS